MDRGSDNPKEVSRRAGHTSVAFTLDRYGHLYPDADERARERLDELIDGAQTEDDEDQDHEEDE